MIPVDRVPPHDLGAERALVGGVLVRPSSLHDIPDPPSPADFYDQGLSVIWTSILALDARKRAPDAVAVNVDLDRQGLAGPRAHGGPDLTVMISELLSETTNAANMPYRALCVRTLATKRRFAVQGELISQLAWQSTASVDQLLDQAEGFLGEVSDRHAFDLTGSGSAESVAEAVKWLDSGEGTKGPRCGFDRLDRAVQGFGPGGYTIIGARPSIGKTSFLLNLLTGMARRGHRVGLISLEMPRVQITLNRLCQASGVSTTMARLGPLNPEACEPELRRTHGHDWREIHSQVRQAWINSLDEVAALPIFIEDRDVRGPADLRRLIRAMVRKHGLEVISLDYLQLVRGDQRLKRHEQVAAASLACKWIARDLGVNMIVCAQLGRGFEERCVRSPSDARPVMGDLKDSGQLEQDADLGILLHRPHHYDSSMDPEGAVAFVAKNRNGPTGKIPLRWLGDCVSFYPATPQGAW